MIFSLYEGKRKNFDKYVSEIRSGKVDDAEALVSFHAYNYTTHHEVRMLFFLLLLILSNIYLNISMWI